MSMSELFNIKHCMSHTAVVKNNLVELYIESIEVQNIPHWGYSTFQLFEKIE